MNNRRVQTTMHRSNPHPRSSGPPTLEDAAGGDAEAVNVVSREQVTWSLFSQIWFLFVCMDPWFVVAPVKKLGGLLRLPDYYPKHDHRHFKQISRRIACLCESAFNPKFHPQLLLILPLFAITGSVRSNLFWPQAPWIIHGAPARRRWQAKAEICGEKETGLSLSTTSITTSWLRCCLSCLCSARTCGCFPNPTYLCCGNKQYRQYTLCCFVVYLRQCIKKLFTVVYKVSVFHFHLSWCNMNAHIPLMFFFFFVFSCQFQKTWWPQETPMVCALYKS